MAQKKTRAKQRPRNKAAPKRRRKAKAKRKPQKERADDEKEDELEEEASNVPGLPYAQRVASAYVAALTRQAADAQRAWSAAKTGKIRIRELGKAFTGTMESYYDALVEVTKGPNYTPRPEYAHFAFKKSEKSTVTTTVPICLQPSATEIESGDLVSVTGKKAIPGTTKARSKSVYKTRELNADRRSIKLELDTGVLKKAPPGHYTGIITAKNHGGSPPLVIVMVTIEK